ncbi:hypothetical protein, partial [Halocynthiibacter sp.]|uniref:hypothetical protein n=1 Tax=Halocynthiibacter sp. TaxID=1979210 RepID=UPI003C6EF9C3
ARLIKQLTGRAEMVGDDIAEAAVYLLCEGAEAAGLKMPGRDFGAAMRHARLLFGYGSEKVR